ncbi:hypothetical protein HK102_004323 [Quaeritorhiza haematococci]|nr:hypothetical protein HK102_004323 [Quaeritorhiza haematococci]
MARRYALLLAVTVAVAAHLLFLASAIPLRTALSQRSSYVDADGNAINLNLYRRGRLVDAAQSIEDGTDAAMLKMKEAKKAVKEAGKSAKKSIKEGAKATKEGIVTGSKKAADWTSEKAKNAADWTSEKAKKIGSKISSAARGVAGWTKKKSDQVCDGVRCAKDTVVGGVKSGYAQVKQGYRDAERAMWTGVNDMSLKKLERIYEKDIERTQKQLEKVQKEMERLNAQRWQQDEDGLPISQKAGEDAEWSDDDDDNGVPLVRADIVGAQDLVEEEQQEIREEQQEQQEQQQEQQQQAPGQTQCDGEACLSPIPSVRAPAVLDRENSVEQPASPKEKED